MCWSTKKPAVLKMAEKDRSVFKVIKQIDERFSSYFKRFPYEIGKLYETKIGNHKVICGHLCIEEGFHSYSNKCKWEPLYQVIDTVYRVVFGNLSLAIFDSSVIYKPVRVSCIIPKGSLYYENEYGEIVSNKIILKEIIND